MYKFEDEKEDYEWMIWESDPMFTYTIGWIWFWIKIWMTLYQEGGIKLNYEHIGQLSTKLQKILIQSRNCNGSLKQSEFNLDLNLFESIIC